MKKDQKKDQPGELRPPVVTVLGHVDHGKTTLLDKIRKTNVAVKEAGGITQSIGASQVSTKEGKRITFIDTPGHAAFSKMRSRGAKVADIALLVVASDDGVKPQTKEALKHIADANIPYLVAATKIDLKTANVGIVQGQLEKEGIKFEGSGGDVPFLAVSGKTGEGIDELLEMISLVSEVNEIKADPKGDLDAVVIETSKDRRGPLASVIVREGTLKTGSEIQAGEVGAKVRGLFDERGISVKEIEPGQPGQILGFSKLPPVGAKINFSIKKVRTKGEEKRITPQLEIGQGKIPFVIKAKNTGSLEDLLANLPKEIVVIYSGVGDVTESDVFMAKSAYPARIFTFESKAPPSVAKLAATEGVEIETFNIIYKLFERVEDLIKESRTKIIGKAKVTAEFPFDNKRIAGCKVFKGRIKKGDRLVLIRGEEELGEIKIISMKKQKQTVSEAKEGEEFGIIFKPQLDFKLGDMILSVHKSKDKK